MVAMYPRQMNSNMPGMSMTTTMPSSSSSTPTAMSNKSGGSPLSPAVIAILAVIGGVVVAIFIGFWIHSKIREYKLKKNPNSSQQLASTSLSVSTYVGVTPYTMGGALATSSDARLEKAMVPPLPIECEQQKPAAIVPPIATDPEVRWVPQHLPAPSQDIVARAETREEVLSAPAPQYAGHPYLAVSMPSQESMKLAAAPTRVNGENNRAIEQTNLFAPIVSPQPVNIAPRSQPPRPLPPPGSWQSGNDTMSYNSATTLVNGRRDPAISSPTPTASPRPLPRIPQVNRTASLVPGPTTSEQIGDRSFLTFDDTRSEKHSSVLQPHVVNPDQRQLEWDNNPKAALSSGKRLMAVIMDYEPELPDELEVKVGDTVRMLREFDDGWCIVEPLNRPGKRSGAVPRMCLQERNSR